MTVKIQESRTYVKKKQREVYNFVNKHKNFMPKLCVPPMICKMYTRGNGLYAVVHQRLVPIPLLMPIVARQQKKKLG